MHTNMNKAFHRCIRMWDILEAFPRNQALSHVILRYEPKQDYSHKQSAVWWTTLCNQMNAHFDTHEHMHEWYWYTWHLCMKSKWQNKKNNAVFAVSFHTSLFVSHEVVHQIQFDLFFKYKAYLYLESSSVSFLINFKMEGSLRADLKKVTMVKWAFVVKI